MIIEKREFHCKACSGIKILKKGEQEPESCPFCGKDKFGKIQWEKKWIDDDPEVMIESEKLERELIQAGCIK